MIWAKDKIRHERRQLKSVDAEQYGAILGDGGTTQRQQENSFKVAGQG